MGSHLKHSFEQYHNYYLSYLFILSAFTVSYYSLFHVSTVLTTEVFLIFFVTSFLLNFLCSLIKFLLTVISCYVLSST